MKKLLVTALLFTMVCVSAQEVQPVTQPQTGATVQPGQPAAQPSIPALRLHAYGTYAFNDNHVDSYYSDTEYFEGSIKGGFQYGGGLELLIARTMGIEFTYLRLDSKAPLEYYNNGIQFTEFDLAQNLLFLSINKYLPISPKVEPFAALQLGMDIFNVENPDNGNTDGTTKFAWGIKAGLNIWASPKVAIKLQAGLLSAVQAIGGGVYFGTGGGGAGISGFSTYYQFSLGGGLVFNLGK
jgi:opacity protein-like surface antigen